MLRLSRRSPRRGRCSHTGCPWPSSWSRDGSTRLQAFATTAITFLAPTRVSPRGRELAPAPSSGDEEPGRKPPARASAPSPPDARDAAVPCPGARLLRPAPSEPCRVRTSCGQPRAADLGLPAGEAADPNDVCAPRDDRAGRVGLARDRQRPAPVRVDVGENRVQRALWLPPNGVAAEACAATGSRASAQAAAAPERSGARRGPARADAGRRRARSPRLRTARGRRGRRAGRSRAGTVHGRAAPGPKPCPSLSTAAGPPAGKVELVA